MRSADVIVIGLGAMGSAAAWALARRGARVLGLEQFHLGHTQGSSHGSSRIIRHAYYEHPDYVPLVRASWDRWLDLELATGEHLLTESPCLSLGPPGSEVVEGVRRSAAEHGLEVETLTPAEVMRRWPAFRLAEGLDCVVERAAGVLAVDRCVAALASEARRLGASLLEGVRVREWTSGPEGVTVRTEGGDFHAGRLVLTAGPWASSLLPGLPLTVMRQVVFWLQPADPGLFRRGRFPIFIAETPSGYFYGLPALDPRGVKVAQHYGAPELRGPEEVRREVVDGDEAPVRAFVREHLPGADGPRGGSSVCLYTLSPDRHFVIGRHPEAEGVTVAVGFSGHGMKFAPVVGEVLAGLSLEGRTEHRIELFHPVRFQK
jgi:sarcosine oxidase